MLNRARSLFSRAYTATADWWRRFTDRNGSHLPVSWAKVQRTARFTIYAALIVSLAFGLAVVIESYRVLREAAFLSTLEPVAPTGNSPGLGRLVTTPPASTTVTTSPSAANSPSSGSPSTNSPAANTPTPSVPALATPPSTTSPSSAAAPLGTLADLSWPVAGQVTVVYGWQASATHGDWRMHTGVDLKAAAGSPVGAAAAGQVLSVERTVDWDVRVTLGHTDGATTVYANLNGAAVKAGDYVTKGQIIGRVGDQGAQEIADGAHVHFEVRVSGQHEDPKNYIK